MWAVRLIGVGGDVRYESPGDPLSELLCPYTQSLCVTREGGGAGWGNFMGLVSVVTYALAPMAVAAGRT